MSLCTVPSCAAPTAPREERCAMHGGALIARHRHVTYAARLADGTTHAGAFTCQVGDDPSHRVFSRLLDARTAAPLAETIHTWLCDADPHAAHAAAGCQWDGADAQPLEPRARRR